MARIERINTINANWPGASCYWTSDSSQGHSGFRGWQEIRDLGSLP